ncbi:glycosyltransferase family 2 protein [Desulfosudis oleivorans]|uniref:Glycosyl transferase family 2 n=1 Tax=Desulfosudis oleivorans (strain DSM 6200 / JCM 39069 / Hxd3) TaxID=96561 RepID=A8ZZ93_DESOH|nr:glycosyltransferase family 2 protein [Desulfosudis oleivorans]ABW67246.1 glycosyl transferase family 2 [Desulfosudis oleivorans Hxd3]
MISFVIPIYNENPSIETLHDRIQKVMETVGDDFEILFVDDGSTDGSVETIQNLTGEHAGTRAIFFRRNFGKSAALSAGFREAAGEIVFTLDGDLQDDPTEIPNFLAKIDEGFDLVTGWKVDRKDPLEKRLPSRLFNAVTSGISGLKLKDYNCGFKCYRKEVIQEIRLYGELHRFVPFLAFKKGFRVAEIPVKHHARKFGSSKFGWERYIRGFFDLFTVVFITNYVTRPIHFLGPISLVLFLMGAGIFVYLFFGRWLQGISIGTSPLLIISFFLMGGGIQVFTIGLLAELVVHNRERDDIPNYSIRDQRGENR